jgi:hypothetical protein
MSNWVHINIEGLCVGYRSLKCPNCSVKFGAHQFGHHRLFESSQCLTPLEVDVDSANKSAILHQGHQLVLGPEL